MDNMQCVTMFKNMVDARIKKNRLHGYLIMIVTLTAILAATFYAATKNDMVTENITVIFAVEFSLSLISVFYIKKTSITSLSTENLDSRDMSKLFDSDHPLALDALTHTKENGFYTYSDLNRALSGYEKILAATEYAQTGLNKKFKVSPEKSTKGSAGAFRGLSGGGLWLIMFLIPLLQFGVIIGVLPTVNELILNQHIPALSLRLSVKEIAQGIILPKLITVVILHFIKVIIKKYIKR